MSERTLKITRPLMRGADVEAWQRHLNNVLAGWSVDLRLKADGVNGLGTRSVSKMVLFGQGFTHEQIGKGVTPWVRARSRNPELRSDDQHRRIVERKRYRDSLRRKFEDDDVAAPLSKILVMTWGWVPGVHDGIDLICGPKAPLLAICDGKVVDVRPSGWWGNAPSGEVWKGDGIIAIECTTDEGPFEPGMIFGYGHAEGADVRKGQRVEAGARLGEAGLAVAWHTHLMARGPMTADERRAGRPRGIGTMDPEPFVRYAMRHG